MSTENIKLLQAANTGVEEETACCFVKVPLDGATDLHSVHQLSPAKPRTAAAAKPCQSSQLYELHIPVKI